MPLLVALGALFFPRVTLFLLWLFTPYVEQGPFRMLIWPLLGLIFVPYTTLALVWGFNTEFGMIQMLAVILGIILDVGTTSNAEYVRRRRVIVVEERTV
ncbi:MAG: hypothetical protein IT462_06025 [Planctomycetes bacterium]|nr:hypothetical protein [Planctomycetota bacterium]